MSESDVVIRVEGLGKKYTIKHEQPARHNTFRDAVAEQARAVGRWANPFTLAGQVRKARRQADRQLRQGEEDFWALKDVSFEIRRGERVGIIGRNGAGKSTLLKILSRITEPTTGRVEIRGRVASLLEVGTGFHPELTGRENVYLNGAILGMTRREIRAKFDEIADFAEVDKFLDTPVKRYSSGMYVRLAFAIAAHLDPDILVVDEVLAVGDIKFQKKCIGKMESVADLEGRTVIVVSHQMGTISSLCRSCIVMNAGEAQFHGRTDDGISHYLELVENSLRVSTNKQNSIIKTRKTKPNILIESICSFAIPRGKVTSFGTSEDIYFDVICNVTEWINDAVFGCYVVDSKGRRIFTSQNQAWKCHQGINKYKKIATQLKLANNFLVPGHYTVTFVVSIERQSVIDQAEIVISIVDTGTVFASYEGEDYGVCYAPCDWKIITKQDMKD